MKISVYRILFFAGIISLSVIMLGSCSTASKAERKYAREDQKVQREAERAMRKDLKAHEKIQSVDTQKMMRKTKREAERYNSFKRR